MSSSSAFVPYAAEADQEISVEELEYLEAKYNAEKAATTQGRDGTSPLSSVAVDTQFFYAWGLIRSKYREDKVRGIALLKDTLETWPERIRECLYYLAIGYYRIGQYKDAARYANDLILLEPSNQQAISLRQMIQAKAAKEGTLGMILVGSIAALAAGIMFAAMRSRASR